MADLDTYHSAVRVQTRQVFMAIYAHPFLLLKLDETAAAPALPAAPPAPVEDDWGSHTRVSTGIGKTGSFSVLRHNAGLYRVYPLKVGAAPRQEEAAAPGEVAPLPVVGENDVEAVITVGRVPSNDVVIADNAISKHQAYFTVYKGGDVTLTDRHSRNGTSVRGRRLAPEVAASVSFGDPIVMGGLALILIGAGALWEIIQGQLSAVGGR